MLLAEQPQQGTGVIFVLVKQGRQQLRITHGYLKPHFKISNQFISGFLSMFAWISETLVSEITKYMTVNSDIREKSDIKAFKSRKKHTSKV